MSRRDTSAALSRSEPSVSSPPLIGLAHGSRHATVAAGIEQLLEAAAELTGTTVRAAYLDLTAPDLETVASELAAAGERRAVIVPLLFTDAFHARIDVPDAAARATASTGVDLALASIIGTGEDVAEVVVDRLAAAGADPDEPVLLYAVGSSRAAANAAVDDLARRLSRPRGTLVRAGFGTTEPRAAEVLTELQRLSDRSGTVVPLFVAPGLLLDAIAPAVEAAGWRLAEPLGTLLAPLVSHRYHAAIRAQQGLH